MHLSNQTENGARNNLYTDANAFGDRPPRPANGISPIIGRAGGEQQARPQGHFGHYAIGGRGIGGNLEPAALLAESLSQPVGDDGGGLGVELADLVAAVVVLGVGEVRRAALGLAPRGVGRPGLGGRSGPAVEPVHEVVLGGEVGPAPEVEPDPRREVHGPADVLGFRDQNEPVGRAAVDRVEGEQRVVVWRRVGRCASIGVGVVDGVELLGLGRVKVVGECGVVRLLLRRRRRRDEVVEGGGLGGLGGVMVENGGGVVVVSGGVGSGVVVGGEHDGGGVSPFVVQHFGNDLVGLCRGALSDEVFLGKEENLQWPKR